jgi:hypothetical protein
VSLVALGALATVHEHTPAALARSSVCCEVLLVTSACAMSQSPRVTGFIKAIRFLGKKPRPVTSHQGGSW